MLACGHFVHEIATSLAPVGGAGRQSRAPFEGWRLGGRRWPGAGASCIFMPLLGRLHAVGDALVCGVGRII